MPKEAYTFGGGVTWNTASAALSTNAGEDSSNKPELGLGREDHLKRIEQSFQQKWDCSQIQEDVEQGYVTDWYEDDEMVRPWRENLQRGGEDCEGEDGRKEPTS